MEVGGLVLNAIRAFYPVNMNPLSVEATSVFCFLSIYGFTAFVDAG
jgi:hypothetical protein